MGRLDEVVSEAVSQGILWVNSGGNNGQERYYRHPVRLAGDRQVADARTAVVGVGGGTPSGVVLLQRDGG